MKYLTKPLILALFCMVVLSTSTEDLPILRELSVLDNTAYGHRLMDLVQLQLNTDSEKTKNNTQKVYQVLEILENIKQDLEATSGNETSTYNAFQAVCLQTVPLLEVSVKSAEKNVSKLEAAIDALKIEVKDLETRLKETNNMIHTLEKTLDQMKHQRSTDRLRYEHDISELVRLRQALKKVFDIISQLAKESQFSLAELPNSYAEAKTALEALEIEQKVAKSLQKIVLVSLRASAREDESNKVLVQHVLDIIMRIYNHLQDLQISLTHSEGIKERLHRSQVNREEGLLFGSTSSADNMVNQLHDIWRQRVALRNDINDVKKLAQQRQQELTDKIAQCDSEKDAHTTGTKQHDDQLRILNEIISMLHSHVTPVSEYVDSRPKNTNSSNTTSVGSSLPVVS